MGITNQGGPPASDVLLIHLGAIPEVLLFEKLTLRAHGLAHESTDPFGKVYVFGVILWKDCYL